VAWPKPKTRRAKRIADTAELPGDALTHAGCAGVWMMPGEMALTRMPWAAYSMASDRVAAARPPLVSAASGAGAPQFAASVRVAVRLTTWPPRRLAISAMTCSLVFPSFDMAWGFPDDVGDGTVSVTWVTRG